MKRAAGNLLLAAGALVLVLCVSEFVLRATHFAGARRSWTRVDARIGWRFEPSSTYWFSAENDHPITGRINAHGWRDGPRSLARPGGVGCRIAVIGDSFVEAFQVERDSTFCARVERALNARGDASGSEVLNFGRSGVTQTEELLLVDEVLAYDPDAVVVLFVPHNDIADMARRTATNPLRPFVHADSDGDLCFDDSFAGTRGFRIRRALGPLKRRSALVSLLAQRYNAVTRARRVASVRTTPGVISGALTLCTDAPDSAMAAQYRLCLRVLEEIAGRFTSAGARVALAGVPIVFAPDEVRALRNVDASFDPGRFERDLAAVANRCGAGLIALQDRFAARAAAGERLVWTHFTYRGHREVAAAVAAWAESTCAPRPARPTYRVID